MGTRGPVPKRSEDRIRRNAAEEVEKVVAIGTVSVPELDMPDAHQMVKDFYAALKESAQSQYYEASDWQHARIVCHFLDAQIKSSKPSGQMLATLNSMMTDMLITEGSRRRVRLEIEREQAAGQVIDLAEAFAQRFAN